MTPQLNYQNLATLVNLSRAKEALQQYLVIIQEMMKNQYPNFPYTKGFDIENQKYVFSQKGEGFTIETGFWFEMQDLYFGMKIIVPSEINSIEQMTFDCNWSYGVEGELYSYYQLFRYVDFMVVASPANEYIDVLGKLKEICMASKEVVSMVENTTSRN